MHHSKATSVKEFIRIPRLNETNQHIKTMIINLAEQLLEAEDISISTHGNKLVLEKDDEKIELPIKKDPSLVSKTIETHYGQDDLGLEGEKITLSELTSLPAIDFEKQKEIKDLIDDLVFCLYFNVGVPEDKVSNADFVKSLCQKNKFYIQIKDI